MTIAETLAERVLSVTAADVPPQVRSVADNLLLDVTGLCVAARSADYVLAAIAGLDSVGSCTAIGHEQTFDSAGAALVNGIAAHGEDFDDTFEGGPVHAGAVIVPAVLAAAERFERDGTDVLRGIAVGVEVMCRLSLIAPMKVHKAGFHPTAVFGAMASAAGVGVTLGLTQLQLVSALGLAGSMAGGIIEYLAEGTWTKRLHAGWAAQSGIRAALLARAGFLGPRTVFEGTHGLFFAFTHGAPANFGELTDTLGTTWLTETLAFKPYACGTMIHPYIDCAIRLAARGVDANEIESIVCEVADGIVHRLWEPLANKQAPPNAYAAKFSSPFCIAAGFYLGDAGLAAFSDATVNDPRIRALAAKTGYVIDPNNPYPKNFTGHLRVTLKNGDVIEERQPHLRGGAHEPLSDAAIEAKFFANAAYGGWNPTRAAAARDMLHKLFSQRVELDVLR